MRGTDYSPPPRVCEHVDMPDTAMQVVAIPPRGATVMACPCCGLRGHKDADDVDPDPMVCPYCLADAVEVSR